MPPIRAITAHAASEQTVVARFVARAMTGHVMAIPAIAPAPSSGAADRSFYRLRFLSVHNGNHYVQTGEAGNFVHLTVSIFY